MSRSSQARKVAFSVFVLTLLTQFACQTAGSEGAVAAGAVDVSAAPAILPAYQARAPRTCANVKSPPSPVVAAALVQCTMDNQTAMGLRLLQDVKVELGTPRPVSLSTDDGLSELDLQSQVYPIRGSYTSYSCRIIDNMVPAAKSCLIATVPAGKGWCWKTSFGDWKCKFGEFVMGDHYGPAPTVY